MDSKSILGKYFMLTSCNPLYLKKRTTLLSLLNPLLMCDIALCNLVMYVQEMRAANMVHFDLRGDNILLEQLPGCSEEEFWAPLTSRPPFNVVLADFGESKMFSALDAGTTVRWGCSL